MTDSDRSRFKVEDLILPFISGSTAERWVLAIEPEETSLILGELCDLYSSLSSQSRSKLPKKQMSNVISLVIIDLYSHDNSLRLNGLKLLRLITEEYCDIIGQSLTQLISLIQDFLQDNSRIIRNSAQKFISLVVIKLPFYLTSSHISTMLESTYQYHEFCMRTASLGLLRFLDESQSSLTLQSRIIQQEEVVLSFARYSIALLQHSSSQTIKKQFSDNKSKRNPDDTDSSDGGMDLIDGLYDAHDASLDLLALCCFALATIDSCKGGGDYSLFKLRQVSCSALLHHVIEVADVDTVHKASQSEVIQRMKAFTFPSLTDEEIADIAREMMTELLKSSQEDISIIEMQQSFANTKLQSSDINTVFSSSAKLVSLACRSAEDEEMLKHSKSRNSVSVECKGEDSDTDGLGDSSKLSSLKTSIMTGSRPSLQRSFSLGEKPDAIALPTNQQKTSPGKVNRIVQSADPIHRSEATNNDGESLSLYPPLTALKSSLFNEENGASSPHSKDNGTEDGRSRNYSRAASSRLKRSRLKQPPPHLQLDNTFGGFEGPNLNFAGESLLGQTNDDFLLVPDDTTMTPVRSKPMISFETNADPIEPPADFTPKRRANHSTVRRKLKMESEWNFQNESSGFGDKSGVDGKGNDENILTDFSATSLPSGLKPDTVEYTSTKDLLPVKNPNQEFSRIVRALESQEWSELFQTLNTLRRIVIHHSQVVSSSGSLHNIVMLTMKLVDNLRSSLAKNALMAVADLFFGLKRVMDGEILTILPGILKRSADSSNFLGESADRVLENMVDYATALRSLVALLGFADHKTATVRAKVAGSLLLLLQRRFDELQGQREMDGLKSRLGKLLQDQNPETRSHAREIAKFLLNTAGMTRSDLENFVSTDLLDKALKDKMSLTTSFYSPLRGVSTFANSSVGRQLDEDSEAYSVMRKSSPHLLNSNNENDDVDNFKLYSHSSGDHRRRNAAENTPSRPSRRKMASDQVADQDIPFSPARSTAPPVVHSPRSNHDNVASSSSNTRKSKKLGVSHSSINASAAAKRILESDPELMQWQGFLITISNTKNWVEKKEALTSLTNILINHYSVLRDVGKLEICLDGLLDRLNDGSAKIVGHTLDCADRLVAEEPAILQTNVLQIVAPKLLNAISSTNKQVSSRSMTLLMGVLSSLSSVQVIQYLCNIAEHEKDKTRIAAIKTLIEMTGDFCSDPDFLISGVKKIIFATTCRVLFGDSTKVEIRLACSDLLKVIQSHVRQDRIHKWAESIHHQEEIKRITAGV